MNSDAIATLYKLRDARRTARDLILKMMDLRGARLDGLRADSVDLSETDLGAAALRGIHWTGCVLRAARLDGCDLSHAVLRLCDLDGAHALDAIATGARLENCSARGASLDRMDMAGALLTDTDFSRASLRSALLTGVEASGANFRGADLRGARLAGASLIDADLRGADLTGADLGGTDLRGADLRGATGVDAVASPEDGKTDAMTHEVGVLAGTMTPIIIEALRTAGQRGLMDDATLTRLNQQAAVLQRHASPGHTLPPDMPDAGTMKAVAAVLDQLGGDAIPSLLSALAKPGQDGPPPEAVALIRRLCSELSLAEGATAEDLLRRLTRAT